MEDIEDGEEGEREGQAAVPVKGSTPHRHNTEQKSKPRDTPLQSASESNFLAHSTVGQVKAVGKSRTSIAPSAKQDQVCR